MSESDQEALEWFNKLPKDIRYKIVVTEYQLHLSIKDIQVNKINEIHQREISSIEERYNEERQELNNTINQLKMENTVLSKTTGFQMVSEQMKIMDISFQRYIPNKCLITDSTLELSDVYHYLL